MQQSGRCLPVSLGWGLALWQQLLLPLLLLLLLLLLLQQLSLTLIANIANFYLNIAACCCLPSLLLPSISYL